jgi:cobalt/nickel transport protein
MALKNGILAAGTVALAVFALAFARPKSGESFGGSDDQACAAIASIDPAYRRWASPLWEPPSSEVESLLFGLQSAAGAGILCYALGFWRGRRQVGKDTDA